MFYGVRLLSSRPTLLLSHPGLGPAMGEACWHVSWHQGGTEADVKARIGKARAVFLRLKNVWSSKDLTVQTKIRIFNSNVKPVLLYSSETSRTTMATTKKVQTFINQCLQRTLRIRWPVTINKKDLWRNQPEACRCWDHDERLETDRPHSTKPSGPVLEPPGKEEKGTA